MKLNKIVKLLKSDNEEDNRLGYELLLHKYKRLWIANIFLGNDVRIGILDFHVWIEWNSDWEYDELGGYKIYDSRRSFKILK